MNNIIVSMYNKSQNEAGPKAKIDVENFLKIYDFKIQDFYFYGGRRAELVSYRQSLFDIPFRLRCIPFENFSLNSSLSPY